MTIWILALVLFALLAAIGYYQGAIRVAVSLAGIFVAALVAARLAGFVRPALSAVGVKNPVLLWLIAPIIVFVVVLCVFKIIGLVAHLRVLSFQKSKADELHLLKWARLNARLGLCLGMVNATAYLALISLGLYTLGYWTVQLDTSINTPRTVRIINRLGRDAQGTGLTRVARAIDPLPEIYYDAADVAGLVFRNPLLEARLSRYPALLSLGERQEFQDIAQDTSFLDMRLRGASAKEVLDYPKTKAILDNPDLMKQIWQTFVPDLEDLRVFLETGKSAKYDSEKILGRWVFDVNSTLGAYRKIKPNIGSTEMQRMKILFSTAYAKTTLVTAPDHQAFLKDIPLSKAQPGATATVEVQTLTGQWESAGSEYVLNFANSASRKARFEGTRLVVTGEGLPLVFATED